MPFRPLSCLLVLTLMLAACSRTEHQPATRGAGAAPDEVILYTSADADVVTLVTEAFEKATGIHVRWVGDTEVTKTTGLVQRLLAEKETPRADVWWSSEPFGTIRLAREGLFDAYTSAAAEQSLVEGWPRALRGKDSTWYGFASRARVFVYNTDRVRPEDAPTTLAAFASPRFKDRLGIARPQFGTTRGHMGVIMQIQGEVGLRAWLTMLRDNGVRIYDSNSAVVRAVATGEVHVGLTDTDDVWSGQRQAFPVGLVYERNDIAANPTASFAPPPATLEIGWGPLVLPNTVALVKGARHPEAAKRFIDFLLSEEVARLLAASDSHNIPVQPAVGADPAFAKYAIADPMGVDLEQAADRIDEAMKLCDELLR